MVICAGWSVLYEYLYQNSAGFIDQMLIRLHGRLEVVASAKLPQNLPVRSGLGHTHKKLHLLHIFFCQVSSLPNEPGDTQWEWTNKDGWHWCRSWWAGVRCAAARSHRTSWDRSSATPGTTHGADCRLVSEFFVPASFDLFTSSQEKIIICDSLLYDNKKQAELGVRQP